MIALTVVFSTPRLKYKAKAESKMFWRVSSLRACGRLGGRVLPIR